MNKIIAVFDGLRFSEGVLQQAINLCKGRQAHVVGVFLHEFYRPSYLFAEDLMLGTSSGRDIVEALKREDSDTYHASVSMFTDACSEAGVEYSVHCKNDTAIGEMVEESLFADLIVVDRRDTFSSMDAGSPSWFIHALLKDTRSPVLAVGKKAHEIERPIFLYDGSVASIYAMKMFTYLFPAYRDSAIEILSMKPDTSNLHVPHHKLVHEWIKRHYSRPEFRTFSGPVPQLIPLLEEREDEAVVITGAYDRSRLSMLLHPSLADELMSKIKAPIFIAHP